MKKKLEITDSLVEEYARWTFNHPRMDAARKRRGRKYTFEAFLENMRPFLITDLRMVYMGTPNVVVEEFLEEN